MIIQQCRWLKKCCCEPLFICTCLFALQLNSMTGCSQISTAPGQLGHFPVVGETRTPESNGSSTEDPQNVRSNLLLVQAELAVREHDWIKAATLLELILHKETTHPEASHLYGQVKVQTGEIDAADDYFLRAIDGQPDNAKFHSDYGFYCYLTNRWDQAETYLKKAIDLDSRLLEPHNNLGIIHARRGQLDLAREHFRLAGCSEAEATNNLAFAQLLEKDVTDALTNYQKAKNINPQVPEVDTELRLATEIDRIR